MIDVPRLAVVIPRYSALKLGFEIRFKECGRAARQLHRCAGLRSVLAFKRGTQSPPERSGYAVLRVRVILPALAWPCGRSVASELFTVLLLPFSPFRGNVRT